MVKLVDCPFYLISIITGNLVQGDLGFGVYVVKGFFLQLPVLLLSFIYRALEDAVGVLDLGAEAIAWL